MIEGYFHLMKLLIYAECPMNVTSGVLGFVLHLHMMNSLSHPHNK